MAERVWLQLASEIVTGDVSSGLRLDEVEQSLRLGVSRTPLRESLRQLAALGLVENRPHRGVVVADDVGHSLFHVLGELEAACARSVAAQAPSAARAELTALAPDHDVLLPALRDLSGNSILRGLLNTLWYPLQAGGQTQSGAEDQTLLTRLRDAVACGDSITAGATAQAYVDLWAHRILE